MLKRMLLALFVVAALAAPAAAQSTVFLIRHAERADTKPGVAPKPGADPDLSAAGHARAAYLTTLLKDANVSAIFVTEFKRTLQTAAPLAKALGLTPKSVPAAKTADLVKELTSSKGSVLVVGHTTTVSDILKGLGIANTITIGEDEFDNLFIVTTGVSPAMIRLHYR